MVLVNDLASTLSQHTRAQMHNRIFGDFCIVLPFFLFGFLVIQKFIF